VKSVILKCLEEMFISYHGEDSWFEVLNQAGLSRNVQFLPSVNVDDEVVISVFNAVGRVRQCSLEKVADDFGNYWGNVYTRKLYGPMYEDIRSARDFFRKLDDIHDSLVQMMPDASLPRFRWDWLDNDTLALGHEIGDDLVHILVAMARGICRYYGESIEVDSSQTGRVVIRFGQ
jgi:hypothetical protein